MIEHWVELPPRPDWGVGIDDRDDRVVPIPDEVRERSTGVPNSTVVWATHDRRGILSDRAEVSWDASPSDRLALRFQRPAKGSGHLHLELHRAGARPLLVAFASKHSEAYHHWLSVLAAAVSAASAIPLDEQDEGMDT